MLPKNCHKLKGKNSKNIANHFKLLASNSFNVFREEFIQAVGQIRSEEDGENSKVEKESKDLDHDKQKDDSSENSSENGF